MTDLRLSEHANQPFEERTLKAVLGDGERLRAVCRVDEITEASSPAFDRLTSLATRVLRVPSATITLIHEDRQAFLSEYSHGAQAVDKPPVELDASFCKHTVVMQEPLIVDDAREHEHLRLNRAVADGVIAYAGVPLIDDDGAVIGSLCAHDDRPRHWTSHDVAVLTDLASGVITEIALRQDIERRQAAESALRESEARFRAMFEHSPEGVAIVDLASKTFSAVNPAFAELHGYAVDELVGVVARTMVKKEDAETMRADWEALFARQQPKLVAEHVRLRKDGSEFWAAATISLLPAHGEDSQVIMYTRDISELKRNETELRYQAQHDALTGLPNRRSFDVELERVTAMARRYGDEATLMMLDLDGFKAVNDNFGHAAGDAVLRGAASAMRETLRGTDVLARLGGDEFAAILHHVGAADAVAIADKVCAAVAEEAAGIDGGDAITVSVGLAGVGPGGAAGSDEVMAAADAALYASKDGGRNRVTVAGASDSSAAA